MCYNKSMPETSKMHPIGTLFSSSWQLYKERFRILIKIALIPALLILLGSIIMQAGSPTALIGLLFSIAGGILAVFASIAAIIALDQKTDFDESYRRSVPLFWPFIWISILTALATLGGFVMLIVPGIILAVALTFSKYLIILENRRGLDALTQSRAYVKGYWWASLGRFILLLLCFGAVMLVVYLPAILILGKVVGGLVYAILLLLITPFSSVYLYEVYKNLVALKPEVRAGAAPTEGKTFLTVSAVVGVIAPIVFIILFIVLAVLFAKPFLENNPALLQQLQYQYEYGMPTSSAGGAATSTMNATGRTAGMHCGGFIRNAPTCPSGYHCQLNLRYPDTGGVCVAN